MSIFTITVVNFYNYSCQFLQLQLAIFTITIIRIRVTLTLRNIKNSYQWGHIRPRAHRVHETNSFRQISFLEKNNFSINILIFLCCWKPKLATSCLEHFHLDRLIKQEWVLQFNRYWFLIMVVHKWRHALAIFDSVTPLQDPDPRVRGGQQNQIMCDVIYGRPLSKGKYVFFVTWI